MADFHFFHIFILLSAVFVASDAALSSSEDYWKSVLPNTPIPKAIRDLLHYSEQTEDESTSVDVGKGDVNVDTGKGTLEGGGDGTKVDVGGERVGVDTGKPGKETNVGVGKGGVFVNTGHKGKPVIVGVHPGPNPFNYLYAASENQLHNNDPNVALFFLEKDLQQGETMNLHFIKSTKSSAYFLPRQVAESIPFSFDRFPQILNKFSVNPNSVEAEIMQGTIKECEEPSIKGEDKYCATSLESMVDFSTSKLGEKVQAISTEVQKETVLQKYRIVGVKKMAADKSVVCHKQNYAYAVFYCHKTDTIKAYSASLSGGADGTKVNAVAVCHTDTSEWNPKHLAFQVLKVKPGTVPVCHFLPEDHVVWIPY